MLHGAQWNTESKFKSCHGKYVSAEPNGTVVANGNHKNRDWEKWNVENLGSQNVALKSHHGKYLSACGNNCGYAINANRDNREKTEVFKVEEQRGGISLKTAHNRYVTVEMFGKVKADRPVAREWETFFPKK